MIDRFVVIERKNNTKMAVNGKRSRKKCYILILTLSIDWQMVGLFKLNDKKV